MIQLRKVNYSDLEDLIKVNSPQTDLQKEQWKNIHLKRIKESEENTQLEYYAVTLDDEVIGHVILRLNGKKENNFPYIEGLMIREDLRGKGFGSETIKTVEQVAKDKGFKNIGLACNPTENPKAKKLYEKLGYKELGNKPYLDGVYDGVEDWVIDMKKAL